VNLIHTNLISEARTLANDIILKNTDPIEKSLSDRRVLGYAAIAFPVIAYFDAEIDGAKLQKIKAKLANLDTVELDKTSSDYEMAVFARDFQKEVYGKIANYTATAQRIKKYIGACSLISFLGSLTMKSTEIPSSLNLIGLVAAGLGFTTVVPGMGCQIAHYIINGTQLDEHKEILARSALKKLSV